MGLNWIEIATAPIGLFAIIALILTIVLISVVLKSTSKIQKLLGKVNIGVIRKVVGIILLAIAVKLFRSNIGLLS
ncbi:MAG: hypothetical protein JKY42_10090 [Flavobacteriales bacterium]|nr:hypothetical protein [Flavobacteriales bacterium]